MRIVNFGQMLDVQSRSFRHQLVVVTDDGRQHAITTDESTVQQLIAAMMNEPTAPTAPVADPQLVAGLQRQVAQRRADPEYDAALRDSEGAFWEEMHRAAPQGEEQEFETGAEIFGEEEDPGEVSSEPVMGVIAEDRVADVPDEPIGIGAQRQMQLAEPRQQPRRVMTDADGFALPVRSRTVPKDEMGYPIVPQNRRAPVLPDDGGEDGTQV